MIAATTPGWPESRIQVCNPGGAGENRWSLPHCCFSPPFLSALHWPAFLRCDELRLSVQDWTKIENEDAEGVVDVTYRSGSEPGRPPDIQIIQKQMAIVAWQPGPNRMIQVPLEVRCLV